MTYSTFSLNVNFPCLRLNTVLKIIFKSPYKQFVSLVDFRTVFRYVTGVFECLDFDLPLIGNNLNSADLSRLFYHLEKAKSAPIIIARHLMKYIPNVEKKV